jgi:hypothetical protein
MMICDRKQHHYTAISERVQVHSHRQAAENRVKEDLGRKLPPAYTCLEWIFEDRTDNVLPCCVHTTRDFLDTHLPNWLQKSEKFGFIFLSFCYVKRIFRNSIYMPHTPSFVLHPRSSPVVDTKGSHLGMNNGLNDLPS